MRKLYLVLLTICCIYCSSVKGQTCATCEASVPTFYVDFTANPDTSVVITSSRSGYCCSASGSQRCIKFVVTVNAQSSQFGFAQSPGNNGSYQINCGPQIAAGTPTCISGTTTFCVTYCNPGGNSDQYTLTASKGFGASADISLRANCTGLMKVQGLIESSITWTSIYPGSVGQYNSYLSSTAGNDTTYVTPTAVAPGTPSYIDYKVCGTSNGCLTGSLCDTIRVYTYPLLTVGITPAAPVICAGGNSSVNLTATPSGGMAPYTYSWVGAGGFSSTSQSITATVAGVYTVTVSDGLKCDPVIQTVTVLESQLPNVTSPPTGSLCSAVAQTYTITADVPGTIFSWSRAAVAGISNPAVTNQSSNPITEALVNTTNAPIQVQYVIVPSSSGCIGATFTYTVTVNPTPTLSSTATGIACSGVSQSYTFTTPVAGSTYTWSRPVVAGISNPAVTNQPGTSITESLINTIATSITVNYQITATANGCSGPAFNYSVQVKPTPVITSAPTGTICNNTQQNYSITSNVGGTTYSWSRAIVTGISNAAVTGQTTNPITESLANTTASPVTVTYLITPSANGCNGNTFTYTVTVNPTPTVTSLPTGTICSATAQNYNIISNVAGTTFSWSRAAVSGISNASVSNQSSNPITEALTNTTSNSIDVVYQVTPTANGCTGPVFNYTVTVNPTPLVTSPATGTVCSGSAQNYNITSNIAGATFKWSRVSVAGISNAAVSNQTSAAITETLINTTTAPINVPYTITASANGCDGPAFTYTVRVNPSPAVNSASTGTICDNAAQNYTISADVAGTSFSWSRPAVAGIANAAVFNQSSNPITESLDNTTNTPITVTYFITPTANGCSGQTFTYTVTVNPTPVVNSPATTTICSNEDVNYTITSNVAGATFSWSRAAVAGISNPPKVNQSGSLIFEPLTNTTNAPIAVTYQITPSANGCTGPVFDYIVTVNPTPVINSAATGSICNNTAQNYTITSPVTGTTFTWSRAAVAGISNPAVSGQTSASITESLTNTTNAPIDVTYVITPSANGCSGNTFTYTVTVTSTVTVSSAATGSICSGVNQNYTITSASTGATFTWSRPAVAGISNPAVSNQSGSSITEALVNTTSSPITVVYVITPALSGCLSADFNYSVTVNPTPTVSSAATGTVCSGAAQNYNINSAVAGATYTWSRPAVTGISNPAVSGQTANTISEALINTTSSPISVTYIITPSANGCSGPSYNYTVTVNPTPQIISAATGGVCNGNALNYQIDSDVAGTSFTWSRPAVSGISNATVSNQTSSSITESLDNITTSAVDVIYYITPTSNGCSGGTFTYTVTVTPTVLVTSAATGSICNNSAQNYTITANVTSASFTWGRAHVNGISNAPVNYQTSNTITETLVNTTNAPIVVEYIITPSVTGCTSADFSYKVTVNPTPTVTSAPSATICNTTAQSYNITSNVAGTTFTWTRAAITGISNPAVIGQTGNSITESLTNTTTAPINVVYTITPSANGCDGPAFSYTVTVNPTPNVTNAPSYTVCNNTALDYTITSDVPGATFTWSRAAITGISNVAISGQNSNKITETLNNTTNAPIAVTYNIVPSYNGCNGPAFNYTVTVNPTAVITSTSSATICSGAAQNYNITSNVAGTTFIWSRAAVTGISNPAVSDQTSGTITESLVNTTNSPITVNYTIIPSANGCDEQAFTYAVTVNPTPQVTSSATGSICNGTALNYQITSAVAGTSFTWSRPAVAGISNPAVSNQTTTAITETLDNTTTSAIDVTYYIVPANSGCSGSTFSYTVTVTPTVQVTSAASGSICNGVAQNYSITANVAGATFSWSRAAVAGISNPAVSNQAGSQITESLTNTTNAPVTVTYVITPSLTGCASANFNYAVTVNPTPTVTSAPSTNICNTTAQNYTISSNVSGATFTWSRAAVAGISNPAVSGQTGNSITETLTNTTNAPIAVPYTIIPSANGCDGPAFTYTVTINPTPTVTSSATATICSGNPQNYTITSDVSGSTFTWSRVAVPGISNPAVTGQAGNKITEALTNTTNSPITVNYVIVATINGCPTTSAFDYAVTVNPTPVVSSTASATVCNNTPQSYTISSNVTGASFTWSRAAVAGISNPAVSNQTSSSINEALENTTSAPITVTYTITPSANGCTGAVYSYAVTVNPTPVVTSTATATICNNTAQTYTIKSNVPGTGFTWTRLATAGISNPAVTNQPGNTITETLINTSSTPVDVLYQINPTANGCLGNSFNYTVTVNPTANVTGAATAIVCNKTAQNYTFSSDVIGATYSWSRAAVPGIANAAVSNQMSNTITEALNNTTNTPINVSYQVSPMANGCNGNTFTYTVTVNPSSLVTSSASAVVCNNTAQNYTITSNVTGATFTWSRPAVTGISNPAVVNQTSNSITESLTNTTNAPVKVTYLVIASANGCDGATFSYTVTVNPTVTVTSPATGTICTGNSQNYTITTDVVGATFSWSRAAVAGISNPAVTNQSGNRITETLLNTTDAPVNVTYLLTATINGCSNTPAFEYVVTVNPGPRVTSASTGSICNFTAQNYLIASNVAGATFTWSRGAVAGISNAAVSNQADNPISESLINTTNSPITVTYNIIPTGNGCSGASYNYAVTVYPTAIVSSAAVATVCNNTPQNYSINSNVTGATFTWSRPMVSGISNPAVSDQKTNKITETLVNTTNTPVDVTYYILPVANGCDGRTFSYTVTVNPTITVTSAASASICNNTPQSYTITSDVTGATFRWSRPTVAGITNAPVSNQASNTIAETLNNTTNAPITVTYFISPTFNSCTGGTFSYSVTVNPTARVTGSATARICNKTPQNYNITSAVSGTSFTWSRADVAGISNAAVMNQTSNIIAETLVNTTSQPIAVPYTIQPAANGCDGATFTYTITVDPTPETPAVTSNAPICLGSNLYLKASTVTGASYRWTGPNGFTSTSQAPSITNVTQAAEGNYEVIAVVNGCESLAGTTSVSISNTGSITKAGSDQVVCGNKALVTLNGSITGGSGTGIWSTSGTGEFGNASSLSTDYTPSAADIASGSVIVTLTSTDNGVCAATSSSAKVTITPAPVADAGQDLAICADKQASLSSGIRIASGVLWTTSGSGTFYPSNTDIKPKYIPSQADKSKGSVKLTMTTTGNGNCNSVTDSTLLTIIPLPYVKAGGERTVLEGHIIKLVPTVSGTNLQYLWTPNRYLSNNTSKDVEVKGVKDETYTITVTGTGGCVSQDEIAIKVLKLFDVPNTFTPNGDGINDTWQIPNLAQYPNCKVLIFNRYGQIVYESVGYSQPWDGLMNGKNVPFGTYYYIIDTGTGSTPRKGFVTLIK